MVELFYEVILKQNEEAFGDFLALVWSSHMTITGDEKLEISRLQRIFTDAESEV